MRSTAMGCRAVTGLELLLDRVMRLSCAVGGGPKEPTDFPGVVLLSAGRPASRRRDARHAGRSSARTLRRWHGDTAVYGFGITIEESHGLPSASASIASTTTENSAMMTFQVFSTRTPASCANSHDFSQANRDFFGVADYVATVPAIPRANRSDSRNCPSRRHVMPTSASGTGFSAKLF